MGDLEHILIKGLHIDDGYIDWQLKRVKYVIGLFGLDFFKGKKVLELGSYQGGITQMFYNLGCDITGVEGSEKNINLSRQLYPHLKFIQLDCEKDLTTNLGDDVYDIIIHWGILSHLEHAKESIIYALRHADHIFLESTVVDDCHSSIYFEKENTNWPDQALDGIGSRMTTSYIEDIIRAEEGVRFTRHDNPKLNSRNQPIYSWSEHDSHDTFRRFWTIRTKRSTLLKYFWLAKGKK